VSKLVDFLHFCFAIRLCHRPFVIMMMMLDVDDEPKGKVHDKEISTESHSNRTEEMYITGCIIYYGFRNILCLSFFCHFSHAEKRDYA